MSSSNPMKDREGAAFQLYVEELGAAIKTSLKADGKAGCTFLLMVCEPRQDGCVSFEPGFGEAETGAVLMQRANALARNLLTQSLPRLVMVAAAEAKMLDDQRAAVEHN